jgi:hypothetical protein
VGGKAIVYALGEGLVNLRRSEGAVIVDVSIKKVGESDGEERFRLINSETRRVLTARDVTEGAIRRFFAQLGAGDELVNGCLERARRRFAEQAESDGPDEAEEDDLLFELGIDEPDEED